MKKNNNSEQISFPGYDDMQRKQQQKRIEQDIKKQEKRKNSLPPFLMIRSGVLNPGLLAAAILIPLYEYASRAYASGTAMEFLQLLAAAGCYGVPIIFFIVQYFDLKSNEHFIQSNIEKYIYHDTDELLPISEYDAKAMARILIQHKSKVDDRMFKRMIENPKSVNDIKTASAIIKGYLESHPEAAKDILTKFNPDTIPQNLRKKLEKMIAKQK